MEQNFEFDAYPPVSLSEVHPPSADTEPMQPVLAAPAVSDRPGAAGIGLAHTVGCLNILVTALTAGTLYAYGLALGYRAHVAVLVAADVRSGHHRLAVQPDLFSAKPLFTCWDCSAPYLIVRVRQDFTAGRRPVITLTLLALVLAGALLSKEVTLLLLPAFSDRSLTHTLAENPS